MHSKTTVNASTAHADEDPSVDGGPASSGSAPTADTIRTLLVVRQVQEALQGCELLLVLLHCHTLHLSSIPTVYASQVMMLVLMQRPMRLVACRCMLPGNKYMVYMQYASLMYLAAFRASGHRLKHWSARSCSLFKACNACNTHRSAAMRAIIVVIREYFCFLNMSCRFVHDKVDSHTTSLRQVTAGSTAHMVIYYTKLCYCT